MSWTTLSATTVWPEPITDIAQHDPSALTVFLVPSTNSVAPLQSTVCSRPMPVTWVSPFLACPVGAPAADVNGMAIAQAAKTRHGSVQFTVGSSRHGARPARGERTWAIRHLGPLPPPALVGRLEFLACQPSPGGGG